MLLQVYRARDFVATIVISVVTTAVVFHIFRLNSRWQILYRDLVSQGGLILQFVNIWRIITRWKYLKAENLLI